ncbi:uncharacterized protein [Temnothorax longispinosus]|uniref:uncharacterized protein n=1 Tax=Temnothorax longispinosus TaxID=300112 RepID=UPI003A995724
MAGYWHLYLNWKRNLFLQIILSQILQHVKDPVFLQMYELLEEKYLPLSTTKGFEKLCERNKLSFYTTEIFKEAINIYIRCRVVYIETGRIDNLAITLTKGNPYTGFMNYHLRKLQLNGVIHKLKNKYHIRRNHPSGVHYGLVELRDVTPTLVMVAVSMVLALLILIIEKVYYSSKTRSKNNNPSRNPYSREAIIRSK